MKTQAISADPVAALALLPLDPGAEAERQWLQNTLSWLKNSPQALRAERLRALAEGINGDLATKNRFQQIWVRAFAPRLFSEAGLPEGTSLAREFVARLKKRLIPPLEDELDLYAALDSADLTTQNAHWIAGLTPEDSAPWRELLGGSTSDLPVAIRLLALRAAAIGLSRGVMKLMPHQYETESPFFELADAAGRFARFPSAPENRSELEEIVLQCRFSAGLAHARMEEQGISSDLVFRLDLVIAQLERIDLLLRVLSGEEDGRRFASMLIGAFAEERGLHSLLRNSMNRMARHIVTHTGKSGEHYIAATQSGWAKMGYGAVGAGAITAFTALFKYSLAAMPLAPLWIGMAHSLNYTVSFVAMQFLGWRLASKMPSMTAAALCDALEKEDGMQSEVKLVAAIARTQFIVTAGNLLGAIPLAFLLDLFVQWKNGAPFLTQEAARHGLESMHPLQSLTIPFAALTGCFLWFSSLVAGWTANWMALNRLPAALAHSRGIRWTLGTEWSIKLGEIVEHHLSGVVGYVCLGLLLGLVPFVSVFAGLPIEVRHITLASASVAYDVRSLASSGHMPWSEVRWAAAGLLCTGILNVSVSFALGLWLALRARNLSSVSRGKLIRALWTELRQHPARFLWRHDFEAGPESA
jgi:site-specific recombinase